MAWSDAFVTNTIQGLNDQSYVLQLADTIGYDLPKLKKELKKLMQQGNRGLGWMIFDNIWQQAFDQVQHVSPDLRFDILNPPIIGVLPTGRVNAVALSIPDQSNHILAFEVGLINFMTYLSNYAANHLVPTLSQAGQQTFLVKEEVDSAMTRQLARMMIMYYQQGIPLYQDFTPIRQLEQRYLSVGLRNMMKLFVVGHEYAHVGLGHLSGRDSRPFAPHLIDQVSCQLTLSNGFQDEWEADQVGLLITLVYFLKKGLPYYFSGAVIFYFLKFNSFIYQGLSTVLQREFIDQSHPPISERINSLESMLSQLLSEQDQLHYLSLKRFYQRLLQQFEDMLMQELAQIESPMELAPIWTTLPDA